MSAWPSLLLGAAVNKESILTSSVLIAAILLLRFLFRTTISRRAQYALWLLVALRLLIPFHLLMPSLEHNVINTVETEPVRQAVEETMARSIYLRPTQSAPASDYPEVSGVLPGQDFRAAQIDIPDAPSGLWKLSGDGATITFYERQISLQGILHEVLLIGKAVMALWLLAVNLSFAVKLRRTSAPLSGAESKYPVYLCDAIPSPCLFGLLRPAIYVTGAAAKDKDRLRYVIAHEETHARHLDPLWSLLRGVCLIVWWFDPLVWLAAYCSKVDCELACDEGVLARMGESERVPYGETLLALIPVRRGGDPMLAATTMTAGKRQMKDRISRIAEHKRPVALALVLVLALTGAVCAATFTGAKRKSPQPAPAAQPVSAPSEALAQSGRYASLWDYLDTVLPRDETVRCYTFDETYPDHTTSEPYEVTAHVLDRRVDRLEMRCALQNLAPNGTLELYTYQIMLRLDLPVEKIVFVGGMGADEDYVNLDGGRAMIVLRHGDGSVDVLHDAPQNDDMGGIWYYQNSESEALHDWYVQEYGLDQPLYAGYLIGSPISSEGVPAHRVDGDGWYFYVPVSAWYRADEGDTARWYSQYNTGSMLSVRRLASADECELASRAARGETADGKVKTLTYEDEEAITTAYLYEASGGGYWQVLTRYYHKTGIHSDMRGLESGVLYAMARSFALDARIHAQKADPVAELRAFAQTLYDEHPSVTLTLFDGGERGSYEGGGTGNSYHICYELMNAAYTPIDAEEPSASERHVRLEALGRALDVQGNDVYFRSSDGIMRGFRAEGNYDYMEDALRLWYDEAELRGVGGDYDEQANVAVPDRGQGYLAAAQTSCEQLLDAHLRVSSGSRFRYTYDKCEVEEAEEETARFRSLGMIGENNWAIFMTEIFVPENETALHCGMAGNTLDYTEYVRDYGGEYDPSVPEGACIRWQCGYVRKEADGYHTVLVGTGW